MNTGKAFEQMFKESSPEYTLVYRIPDAAQSFGKSSQTRFSRKNPFDFLIWDSIGKVLFALELKTVKGKTISFERNPGESKEIHKHQIDGLNEWNQYDGIICGFIIEFRQIETTIFLEISEFNKILDVVPKKSFTLNDLDNNNIAYIVIPQEKMRTRYKYDVDKFINEIRNNLKGDSSYE